jgi:hypothetical protein
MSSLEIYHDIKFWGVTENGTSFIPTLKSFHSSHVGIVNSSKSKRNDGMASNNMMFIPDITKIHPLVQIHLLGAGRQSVH